MVAVEKKKLAVLISGRGSNMEAILNATQEQGYSAEIGIVISDNSNAKGLEIAKAASIEAIGFNRCEYKDRPSHEAVIMNAIDNSGAELICLAGYMRILSRDFVEKYKGRLLNIHPSLLPAYKGLDTHARVLDDGTKIHGCTVHYVSAEMDGGAIIAQAAVPVLSGDDEVTLAKRVLKQEHKLYRRVVSLIADGYIDLDGDTVVYRGVLEARAETAMFSIEP